MKNHTYSDNYSKVNVKQSVQEYIFYKVVAIQYDKKKPRNQN